MSSTETRDIHHLDMSDTSDTFEEINLETITIADDLRIHSVPDNDTTQTRDELFANLQISLDHRPGNHTLTVKVDTGAQGNILPTRLYKQIYPEKMDEAGHPHRSELTQRQTTLPAYNGTPIPQYGCVSFLCRYGVGEWNTTAFYVVDTESPAILGLPSSKKMKLVSVNCAMTQNGLGPIKDKYDLQARFPDRFTGIGKFPGTFHITLQQDARPVVHPPRKLPIHLKDELEEKLHRMEKIGVIKKVTDPTDWVSSLAVSRKSNGQLRVCFDPKDLNRATICTHHKVPTLEELTHKLHGAQVMSKLDARHGYWSVVLDEDSSFLTTFNSLFGRFRYLRLPFGLNVSQDILQLKMDMILEKCPGTIGIADDIVWQQ